MTNQHRHFSDTKHAFLGGLKYGAGAPAWVLFAGMIGFGAMCRNNGLDIWITTAITVSLFALPGQVVFVEMMSMGAAGLSVALAVALTATRFLTMVVTLFPQMHSKSRDKTNFLAVHLLSMSSWAICMKEFPAIKAEHRYAYFIGIGLACWGIAIPGTAIGYLMAGSVPKPITYGFLFINPLFFLLTFADVVLPMNRLAIILGGVAGCFLYLQWPEQSLLIAGATCGTFAYLLDYYWRRKRRLEITSGGD